MKKIKEIIEHIKFLYIKHVSLSKYDYRIELCKKKQINLREQMEISNTIIDFLDKGLELLLQRSLLLEEAKKNSEKIKILIPQINSTVEEYYLIDKERIQYTEGIKDRREQLEKEYAELEKEFDEHVEKYGK